MLDYKTFAWKDKKVYTSMGVEQDERKIIDMTKEELQDILDYSYNMIYSKDHQNPGRLEVYNNIKNIYELCGAELFIRYVATVMDKKVIYDSIEERKTEDTKLVTDVFDSVPDELINVRLDYVQDLCSGKYLKFNKRYFTRRFLLRQKLWLTREEKIEFSKGEGELMEKVRVSLGLHEFEKLRFEPTGLTFDTMKSMFNLHTEPYYCLTLNQLNALYYIVCQRLMDDVAKQINEWKERCEVIIECMKAKGYDFRFNDKQ